MQRYMKCPDDLHQKQEYQNPFNDPTEDEMGKSGNPAKAAEDRKISQVGDFKKRMGGMLTLPSGFVVKVKNPGGLRAFMSGGLIPNSLMAMVQDAINKGKKPNTKQIMPDGKIDPQMLQDMIELTNSVAMACIVEPKIHPIPEDEEDRSDDLLYVDELPDDDKQFIFQWVSGGTRDLETFRRKHEADVDAVAAVTSAGSNSELNSGADAGQL